MTAKASATTTRRTIGKPRGVLHAHPGGGIFAHERHAPAEDLAPFVEHFWMVSWQDVAEPVVRETLPHPSVHVVLERGQSAVAGVPRGRFTRTLEGTGLVFGIKFRPGGFRPLITYAVSELTGRSIELGEIFGTGHRALERAVLGAPSTAKRVEAASKFLRRRLPPPDPRVHETATIVELVLTDRDIRSVEDIADKTGTSPRALQRLFKEWVGVSPKWVIRRYRLHEALERVNAGHAVDWTALALELGFFDQAHFIRDFKTLVGQTPADYARRVATPLVR